MAAKVGSKQPARATGVLSLSIAIAQPHPNKAASQLASPAQPSVSVKS
jgi:hypothetical protein